MRWICEQLGAQVLPVETQPEWNITGSLLNGFDAPVYRFIPGITRSEGLFLCVLRKPGHPVALDYTQAIAYLRGEAITLPDDAPRGIVEVSFMDHVLGTVKNIGSRANNLYPKEWRIKSTYIPEAYEAILRHT